MIYMSEPGYKIRRRLGTGAFGEVFLVEDEKGEEYALKQIPLPKTPQTSHLKDYFQGQIQCMQQMSSPHIVKLFHSQQDQDFIYLFLQYCDLGDLFNYQSKVNKNKVFGLSRATEILSDIIIGLEYLHSQGYLHRDIKLQNILVKREEGREVFKLADFGFSKKIKNVKGTVIGTEAFRSPQLFETYYIDQKETYGFEIDMWAFGVLFYFMLNFEFPFSKSLQTQEINPLLRKEQKHKQLVEQATNFSYAAAVKRSKKKRLENCTVEVEDLFKRMFEVDPKNRISFHHIRSHPLFSTYFPFVSAESEVLYSNKLKKPKKKKHSEFNKKQSETIAEQQHLMFGHKNVAKKRHEYFQAENRLLERKRDSTLILKIGAQYFLGQTSPLQVPLSLMLAHDLSHYYLHVLQQFRKDPESQCWSQPSHKWAEYLQTKQFSHLRKEVCDDIAKARLKIESLRKLMQSHLQKIKTVNRNFESLYFCSYESTLIESTLWSSFRRSVSCVFGILRSQSSSSHEAAYALTILMLCYGYQTYIQPKVLSIIFGRYFKEKDSSKDNVDYLQLASWLSEQGAMLAPLLQSMLRIYFRQ